MKRLTDLFMALLFAAMLSACGKQSEEGPAEQTEYLETGGQTGANEPGEQAESPESMEQAETSGTAAEEPSADAGSEESGPEEAEDTRVQEGDGSAMDDITFYFELKTVMLNSGYEMPLYGLGTYSLTGETCVDSVTAALNSGVRLIDTAYMYHNDVICCEL